MHVKRFCRQKLELTGQPNRTSAPTRLPASTLSPTDNTCLGLYLATRRRLRTWDRHNRSSTAAFILVARSSPAPRLPRTDQGGRRAVDKLDRRRFRLLLRRIQDLEREDRVSLRGCSLNGQSGSSLHRCTSHRAGQSGRQYIKYRVGTTDERTLRCISFARAL